MNFEVEPELTALRTKLLEENVVLILLPLLLMVPLEFFVSYEHNLGVFHTVNGFALTAALFLY
jgi:hypothetical protein